jgi:predicted nucleotide-binding protein (sugar kinase/HSP70/actin superfamily)
MGFSVCVCTLDTLLSPPSIPAKTQQNNHPRRTIMCPQFCSNSNILNVNVKEEKETLKVKLIFILLEKTYLEYQ